MIHTLSLTLSLCGYGCAMLPVYYSCLFLCHIEISSFREYVLEITRSPLTCLALASSTFQETVMHIKPCHCYCENRMEEKIGRWKKIDKKFFLKFSVFRHLHLIPENLKVNKWLRGGLWIQFVSLSKGP